MILLFFVFFALVCKKRKELIPQNNRHPCTLIYNLLKINAYKNSRLMPFLHSYAFFAKSCI